MSNTISLLIQSKTFLSGFWMQINMFLELEQSDISLVRWDDMLKSDVSPFFKPQTKKQ